MTSSKISISKGKTPWLSWADAERLRQHEDKVLLVLTLIMAMRRGDFTGRRSINDRRTPTGRSEVM